MVCPLRGLPRGPQICVHLPVQCREEWLKGCWQHIIWNVSNEANVMFTDKSRFTLQPNDKHIKAWIKISTHNRLQYITEYDAFRSESIIVWATISMGYRNGLHIIRRGPMEIVVSV